MAGLRRLRCVVWVLIGGNYLGGFAQQPQTTGQAASLTGNAAQSVSTVASAPVGTVTGTVLSADTQRPVRFAIVSLQSVEAVAQTGSDVLQRRGGGRGGQATTEIDGTFNIEGVTPGDYYVVASATGYIPERSRLLSAVNSGADPAQLLARIPVVHVVADSSSNVVVSLQRGGVLAGHVVWEDGSAATGVNVSASFANQQTAQLPPPLSGLQLNGLSQLTVSDDRGDFRIAGLPTGDYIVQAVIQSRGSGFAGGGGGRVFQFPATVRVYAPGVYRKSAAKAYAVRAGDERTDVQLVIDVRGLHSVSGHIGSTDSSQSVASGRISLTDPNDPTLQIQGAIDAHGDFLMRYVPPGNYTLQVIGASTSPINVARGRGADSTPVVTFRSFSQAITVTDTDLSGFTANLTPDAQH